MPTTLGFRDTLAAAFSNDTISYVLPDNVNVETAPNAIIIDGFATLRMERTRVSLRDNTLMHMVDKAVRQPMHVAPVRPIPGPVPAVAVEGAEPRVAHQGPVADAQAQGGKGSAAWCVFAAALGGFLVAAACFAPVPPVAAGIYAFLGCVLILIGLVGVLDAVKPTAPATANA